MTFFFKTSTLIALCIIAFSGVAQSKSLNILTDIGPIQSLVSQISEGAAVPTQLVTQKSSPHDFALRPSDIRKLQAADVVIWTGPRTLPGLAKIMNLPDIQAKSLRLNAVEGLLVLPLRKSGPVGQIRENDTDPHLWLSPDNARLWASEIAVMLSHLDPDNADLYDRNASTLIDSITAASLEIQTRLAPFSHTPFVQYHDAFYYFENHFGLKPLGLATSGDEETASLGLIADLRTIIMEHPNACVFVQSPAQAGRAKPLVAAESARLGQIISPTTGRIPFADLLIEIAIGYLNCFEQFK